MNGVKVTQVKASESVALFSLIFTMVLGEAIAPSLSACPSSQALLGLFLFRGVSVAEQPAAAPNKLTSHSQLELHIRTLTPARDPSSTNEKATTEHITPPDTETAWVTRPVAYIMPQLRRDHGLAGGCSERARMLRICWRRQSSRPTTRSVYDVCQIKSSRFISYRVECLRPPH